MRTLTKRALACFSALVLALAFCVPCAIPSAAQAATSAFGSSATMLEQGSYDVPVALKKAGDTSQVSAAAAMFPLTGRLSVSASGQAALQLDLGPVSMMGLTDYAYDVRVYQGTGEGYASSQLVPAQVDSTITTPESTYAGAKTVPSSITIDIPNASADGVYLCFHVDAMNSDTDAYLAIDYSHAVEPGEAMEFTASSHVEQFGEYDVTTTVSVKDGVITGIDAEGSDFQGSRVGENRAYLAKALKGLKSAGLWDGIVPVQSNADEIYNKIYKNKNTREAIDVVSGATYSAEAIRNGVMAAFGLTHDEQAYVPKSIEAGTYTVPVSAQTEYVRHYLDADKTATATLKVAQDGTMTLDFPIKAREDLFVLDVSGYYANNDVSAGLSTAGLLVQKTLADYEDEYFAAGTQAVSRITLPLVGGLADRYRFHTSLYVPPMNGLTGEFDGIKIEHGYFDIASDAVIDWEGLSKVSGPSDDEKALVKGGVTYRVLSEKAKTAQAVAAVKNIKTASIPATVQIDGTSYKVSSVGAKAFKGKAKLVKVTLGKNVATIGATAFQSCKKLKSIIVKGTELGKIGKSAFKGISARAKFTIPKKSYKAKIKKAGAPKKASFKISK